MSLKLVFVGLFIFTLGAVVAFVLSNIFYGATDESRGLGFIALSILYSTSVITTFLHVLVRSYKS